MIKGKISIRLIFDSKGLSGGVAAPKAPNALMVRMGVRKTPRTLERDVLKMAAGTLPDDEITNATALVIVVGSRLR